IQAYITSSHSARFPFNPFSHSARCRNLGGLLADSQETGVHSNPCLSWQLGLIDIQLAVLKEKYFPTQAKYRLERLLQRL
ncbi:MAG: hypothetical protein AB2531_05855, partial [Candidatus Thiodiazotropha sp.]